MSHTAVLKQERKDYFSTMDNVQFAGMHYLLGCWQCTHLDCMDTAEQALRRAVQAAGATLLKMNLLYWAQILGPRIRKSYIISLIEEGGINWLGERILQQVKRLK